MIPTVGPRLNWSATLLDRRPGRRQALHFSFGVYTMRLTAGGDAEMASIRVQLHLREFDAAEPAVVATSTGLPPTGSKYPADGTGVPAEFRELGRADGAVLTVQYLDD